MQFNTLLFLLIFLPLFTFGMLLIKENKYRNILILTFSLLFYFLNDSKYFTLLLMLIVVSYLFAMKVKDNKSLYIFYLVLVISLLCFFKYGSFVLKSLKEMNILMPLGISYYLFMSISYVSDCYYSKYDCSKSLFEVASYISFFPCITCGPLIRFSEFSKYYQSNKEINSITISNGLKTFILGLGKKVVIADQIGYLANAAFDKTTILSTPLAWAGAVAAGLQIFYDFSGYSDMAIGVSQMIGFNINKNFDYPFISQKLSEFWKRWHISLGMWFRDYVYIPLGGNRVKKIRFILNILIVWILTGLWHGSTINYLIWGLLMGILVLVEKAINIKPNKVVGIIIVNLVFLIGVVLFKSNDINSILFYIKNMFTWTGLNLMYYKLLGILYLWPIIIVAILFVIPKTMEVLKKNEIVFDVFIIMCLLLSIVYLVGGTQQTFVYFAI